MSKIHTLLNLDKPIIFFDLETTGVRANNDRIVEFSAVKIYPAGKEEFKTLRLNPEMPIPQEAINIHGITDEDVKDAPIFKKVAASLFEFFSDCHLGGFGIRDFDIYILEYEFKQAGFDFKIDGRAVIDTKTIFHNNEPRDLTAALKFYCNKQMENAHSSKADVDAAIDILNGQFNKYKEKLPQDIYELDGYCNPKKAHYVDRRGKFIWVNSEATFNFGKHSGKPLKEIVKIDKSYLDWVLKDNFSLEIKEIISSAIKGSFPSRN